MRRNLDHIVSGIGMRSSEVSNHNLVDALRLCRGGRLVRSGAKRGGLILRLPHPCPSFSEGQGGASDFVHRRRFNQLPKHGPPRLQFIPQPQHGRGNPPRIRSRDPHHSDPTPPRRSRNRDDSVIQVHAPIVNWINKPSLVVGRWTLAKSALANDERPTTNDGVCPWP